MLVIHRLLALFLVPIALTACSASTAIMPAPADVASADPAASESSAGDRVMIYDAELVIEAAEPDSLVPRASRLATRSGGYVLEAGVRVITVRIPSDRLDAAMESVLSWGELLDRRVEGQDVTERYRDLELRLSSARRSRDRYLDLLDRAANVPQALQVEKELERIDRQIESLEGELNALRERVRFSTLTIRHRDQLEPGPVGWVFTKIGAGVKWLFVRD